MPEMSTAENEQIVSRIYEATMNALHANKAVSADHRRIHDIEHLMQEVNSGASFEQYFRWATVAEINSIRAHLQAVGLGDVAALVTQAIEIAFPKGLPSTDEEKSEA